MTWRVDPAHSSALFSGEHLGLVAVRGFIRRMEGTVAFDEADGRPTAVELTLDARTLDTGLEARDEQLRGPRFLDVERFPFIRFVSRSVEPGPGPGLWRVAGELTLRGVTRPVTLDVTASGPVTNHRGQRVLGLRTRTALDRKEFGMTERTVLEGGILLTGEEIRVEVDVEAVKEDSAGAG